MRNKIEAGSVELALVARSSYYVGSRNPTLILYHDQKLQLHLQVLCAMNVARSGRRRRGWRDEGGGLLELSREFVPTLSSTNSPGMMRGEGEVEGKGVSLPTSISFLSGP